METVYWQPHIWHRDSDPSRVCAHVVYAFSLSAELTMKRRTARDIGNIKHFPRPPTATKDG